MPRIEMVPIEDLPQECQEIISEGQAGGWINSTMYLQILGNNPAVLWMKLQDMKRRWHFGVIEPRLQELLRLRGAQVVGCQPCAGSRKEKDLVSEEVVTCMYEGRPTGLSERESVAIRFLELLAQDHFSIDDDFYRELGDQFSAAEIVELGEYIAWIVGGQTWGHTLDQFNQAAPIIARATSTFEPLTLKPM
jgi:alkylhydroperoxidase family enzyme